MEKIIGFNLQLTEEQYNYLVELELREPDELGVLRMIIGMYKEEENAS